LTSRRGSPSAAAEAGEAQSCRSRPGRGHCGLRTAAAVAAAGDGVAVVVVVGADGGVADVVVGGAGADAGSDQTAYRAGQTGLRPSTASVGACWEGDAMLGACQRGALPSAATYWGWKQPAKWKHVSTTQY
jgi:hypothetical protein